MTDKAFQPAPVKASITFAEFEKVDIRVGTILSVEDVSGSDKLVRLVVDFGDHQRSILAGLKHERADPGSIKGSQALFVVNLEPRKMMGESSEECCSTLVTPTACSLCWLCRKVMSRMERGPDETADEPTSKYCLH